MKNKTLQTLSQLTFLASLFFATSSFAAKTNPNEGNMELEKLADVELSFTQITDYGTPLAGVLEGKIKPPPQGARIDIHFAGKASGVLSGKMSGVDYANIRADGRFELNIFAEIITLDGARIAYQAQGVSIPQSDGTARLREAVQLTTSFEKYQWVNGLTFIVEGVVNPSTGKLSLTLFR